MMFSFPPKKVDAGQQILELGQNHPIIHDDEETDKILSVTNFFIFSFRGKGLGSVLIISGRPIDTETFNYACWAGTSAWEKCSAMLAFVVKIKMSVGEKFRSTIAHPFSLRFSSLATDLPDPVTNCTAYNATAYTMQFACIPGNDGGIRQSFFVEVINFDGLSFSSINSSFMLHFSQVFDGREKVFNVSSELPTFMLRKLPSDTILVVRVSIKKNKKSFTTKKAEAFAPFPATLEFCLLRAFLTLTHHTLTDVFLFSAPSTLSH